MRRIWNSTEWYEKVLFVIPFVMSLVIAGSSVQIAEHDVAHEGAWGVVCCFPSLYFILAIINTYVPLMIARRARNNGHDTYSKFIIIMTFLGLGIIAPVIGLLGFAIKI